MNKITMHILIPVIVMAAIFVAILLCVLREAFREFDRGPRERR